MEGLIIPSIGSPFMNQLMVGRGTPSERHTSRPVSSGARIKFVGFSTQNGAAVNSRVYRLLKYVTPS